MWKEVFGEDPTSPGGWRERIRLKRGLRGGDEEGGDGREDGDGEGEGEGCDSDSCSGSCCGAGNEAGTRSGVDDDGDFGGNEDAAGGGGFAEGIRSRGNSVVIASAHELVKRVRKRSNSLGTFLRGMGAKHGQDVNVDVEVKEERLATRKRSHTFTTGLWKGISVGDTGLRERKGSVAIAPDTVREGDVERASGQDTDLGGLGGRFDGSEERDGTGGSEKRRGSWVQVLRRYSGLGDQNGVRDPEKGGYWY